MEREIQKQIQERSRQIVQDVLQRSANQIMPLTPLEVARASLSQCFQKALATPRTELAPPTEQPRGQTRGESAKYSLADPFVGINPPPPEALKESNPDHPARGRATMHLEWPPEEKKRRSSSRPRGEVEPKHGWSSGAEPSWDVSKVGSQQSDKARSQPASEPEALTPPPKLKSAEKSVRLNLPKPEDLEGLARLPKADMMIPPRTIGHGEISPDTILMPTTDRAPKVLVVPTGDPEGMTGGPARALTRNLQSTILKKAWAPN